MYTVTVVNGTLDHFPIMFESPQKAKKMTDKEFVAFCAANRDLRIERNQYGDIEIMAPAGTESGNLNFELNAEFGIWVKKNGKGRGFDSSTGFTLPNGAVRSPDFSWMTKEKFDALDKKDREKFAHVCPDFVVELRSKSDTLKKLREKMEEYIENGASLGWLIDPLNKKVHIYRPEKDVETLDSPEKIYGRPYLKGLVIKISEIW